jgi:hypothetical protein
MGLAHIVKKTNIAIFLKSIDGSNNRDRTEFNITNKIIDSCNKDGVQVLVKNYSDFLEPDSMSKILNEISNLSAEIPKVLPKILLVRNQGAFSLSSRNMPMYEHARLNTNLLNLFNELKTHNFSMVLSGIEDYFLSDPMYNRCIHFDKDAINKVIFDGNDVVSDLVVDKNSTMDRINSLRNQPNSSTIENKPKI